MGNHVIALGRQFGSGGREIGRKLGEALGFAYYDRELLTLAAKRAILFFSTRTGPPMDKAPVLALLNTHIDRFIAQVEASDRKKPEIKETHR